MIVVRLINISSDIEAYRVYLLKSESFVTEGVYGVYVGIMSKSKGKWITQGFKAVRSYNNAYECVESMVAEWTRLRGLMSMKSEGKKEYGSN